MTTDFSRANGNLNTGKSYCQHAKEKEKYGKEQREETERNKGQV